MSLVALIKGKKGKNGFGYASTAEEVTQGVDLSGKTVLITGVNSGLGAETARVLSLRGATLIGTGRTEGKAKTTLSQLGSQHVPLACDLSDLGSVVECAKKIKEMEKSLDVIICNAGIMGLPELKRNYDIEMHFLVNHLGHFALVNALIDRLAYAANVVVVSSEAHRQAPKDGIKFEDLSGKTWYGRWTAYGHSKLANILFVQELARRFEDTGRLASAVHPGVVSTGLSRNLPDFAQKLWDFYTPLFGKSVAQGAATSCFVACRCEENGRYWVDSNVATPSKHALDKEMASDLWEVSEDLVKRALGMLKTGPRSTTPKGIRNDPKHGGL